MAVLSQRTHCPRVSPSTPFPLGERWQSPWSWHGRSHRVLRCTRTAGLPGTGQGLAPREPEKQQVTIAAPEQKGACPPTHTGPSPSKRCRAHCKVLRWTSPRPLRPAICCPRSATSPQISSKFVPGPMPSSRLAGPTGAKCPCPRPLPRRTASSHASRPVCHSLRAMLPPPRRLPAHVPLEPIVWGAKNQVLGDVLNPPSFIFFLQRHLLVPSFCFRALLLARAVAPRHPAPYWPVYPDTPLLCRLLLLRSLTHTNCHTSPERQMCNTDHCFLLNMFRRFHDFFPRRSCIRFPQIALPLTSYDFCLYCPAPLCSCCAYVFASCARRLHCACLRLPHPPTPALLQALLLDAPPME